ncbi:MAG: hypothetical protein Q7T55_24560 [Solirubrobacteraceae bacterium]|nr:hypothetical protein [Solirubrobacteraceae bacterium]
MSPTSPRSHASRRRHPIRFALALTTLASTLALPVVPASAHHDGHAQQTTATSVTVGHGSHAVTTAPGAARAAATTSARAASHDEHASAAGHDHTSSASAIGGSGASSALDVSGASKRSSALEGSDSLEGSGASKGSASLNGSSASTSMFVVGTAADPLLARRLRTPLWIASPAAASPHRADGGKRYVAAKLAELRGEWFAAEEPVATRLKVLTTAQATKKLSKSCQKLVKITAPKAVKKLSKANRKKRTKCLEQRRKFITDSKKKKPSPNMPGVSPTPAPVAGPAPTTGTDGSPAPAAPTPTPKPGTTPAPTPTPRPGSTPAPTPRPTPTPFAYPACTPVAGAITVTAADEVTPFTVTSGCASAGTVTFNFTNGDPNEEDHNVWIGAANAAGKLDTSSPPVAIVGNSIASGETRNGRTINLAPGKYVLICTVPGHDLMTVVFQVF